MTCLLNWITLPRDVMIPEVDYLTVGSLPRDVLIPEVDYLTVGSLPCGVQLFILDYLADGSLFCDVLDYLSAVLILRRITLLLCFDPELDDPTVVFLNWITLNL